MIEQPILNRLARRSEQHAIDLLRGGKIELRWEHVALHMRTTDLLVLNTSLQAWLDDPDREWAETYSLLLNEHLMVMRRDELYHLCHLVEEAATQLPARPVRWADLNVQVMPYTAEHRNRVARISSN